MKHIIIKTEKGEIKLNEHDAMLIVKEWYLNGMQDQVFMNECGYELDEDIDIEIG